MRLVLIAFSAQGAELARRIAKMPGFEAECYIAERHAGNTGFEPFDSVYELTGRIFDQAGALVFISACAIAVRAVAPYIKSKLTDPAVIACDETGRFAVSLLSGHVGRANALADRIAAYICATPVITTASDSHAILDCREQPRNLVLGIGCRRGLSAEAIERAATVLLWDEKIPLARVLEIATIDIKRDDAGLLGFAKAHKLPVSFYPARELEAVPGEFASSGRVLRAVGVDNVCERAAVICGCRGGGKGKLILRKTAKDGVTVAAYERERD